MSSAHSGGGMSSRSSKFSVELLHKPGDSQPKERNEGREKDRVDLFETKSLAFVQNLSTLSDRTSSALSDAIVALPLLPRRFVSSASPSQRSSNHSPSTALPTGAPPVLGSQQGEQELRGRKGVLSFKERQRLAGQKGKDVGLVQSNTDSRRSGFHSGCARGTISFSKDSIKTKKDEKDDNGGDSTNKSFTYKSDKSTNGNETRVLRKVMSSPTTPRHVSKMPWGMSVGDSQRVAIKRFKSLAMLPVSQQKGIDCTVPDRSRSHERESRDVMMNQARSASTGTVGKKKLFHSITPPGDMLDHLFPLTQLQSSLESSMCSILAREPTSQGDYPGLFHGIQQEEEQRGKGGEDQQQLKESPGVSRRRKNVLDGSSAGDEYASNLTHDMTWVPLALEGEAHNYARQVRSPPSTTAMPPSMRANQLTSLGLGGDRLVQLKVASAQKQLQPLVPSLLEEQARATTFGFNGPDRLLASNLSSPQKGLRDSTPVSPPPRTDSRQVSFGLCRYECRNNLLDQSQKEAPISKTHMLHGGLPRLCSATACASADRRERDKVLRRQVPHTLFLPTPQVIEKSAATPRETGIRSGTRDNFLQQLQRVDEGSSSSVSLSTTQQPELSVTRTQTFEVSSILAATRENRKSSFSSLYFSMTKNHGMHRHMSSTIFQSQLVHDDDNKSRGIPCPSTLDDLGSTGGDFIADSQLEVGVVETEEHVFLPRYEFLDDGRTPMEVMLSSIRAASGSFIGGSASVGNPEVNAEAPTAPMSNRNITGGFLDDGDDNNEVFTFGSVSPAYTIDPMDENPLVDCKIASRLLFNAENGVMLISAKEEVGKYIQPLICSGGGVDDAGMSGKGVQQNPQDGCDGGNGGREETEDSNYPKCTCSAQFIMKDTCGMDYSRCHANELYHHCIYCNRRPAAFLCLQCMKATCPSHVTQHYKECETKCTLFLNQLDIMTSYDRIFWCEKCFCFTWKHTGIYDLLVDRLAVTRGTYLQEAVRDISCVGYDVQLKPSPSLMYSFSVRTSPPRERGFCYSYTASPNAHAIPMADTVSSSMLFLPDLVRDRVTENSVNNNNYNSNIDQSSFTVCYSGSPMRQRVQRNLAGLTQETEVLCVGEAVPKLVSLGAKVQGWRTTQEDAEAAFVIDIPAMTSSLPLTLEGSAASTKATAEGGDVAPGTIAMAVFCVFDGHGGDAVAKLAATHFEAHLRKAVASGRHEDVQARALLFQLDVESSPPPPSSLSAGSPNAMRDSLLGSKLIQCWSNNVDNDISGASFTMEALRRHVERSKSTTTEPIKETTNGGGPSGACFALGGAAPCDNFTPITSASPNSASWLRSNASPVVSRRDMEMLRAYFASIMEDALLSLDDHLRHTPEGRRGDYQCTGCTACIVGITTNFILCANVGDSGAAFYTPRGIRRISVTHRTTNPTEVARIKAAGYSMSGNRIEGMLAVARALGDYDFKQCGGRGPNEQAVTAVPDVTIMPVPLLHETTRWGVILACDGVWDTATLHQIHHAIVNTTNDMDVAGSAMEVVLRAKEMEAALHSKTPTSPDVLSHSESPEKTTSVDALLLTSAAGIFAQCVAPHENDEGIGMDNCSLFLIERR